MRIINIGNHQFKVKECLTLQEKIKGMQNQVFDGSFDGMFFDMKSPYQSFWMKDCIVSLDIIMIDENRISVIHHDCPPCKTNSCRSYHGKGSMVLELPGGTCKKLGIITGDLVDLS